MGEMRTVGPGKTHGYPYPVCKKKLAPMGVNSFIYGMTPIYMEGKDENNKIAVPESLPIHL